MAAARIRLRPSLLHTVSRRPFRQASEAILTNRVTRVSACGPEHRSKQL